MASRKLLLASPISLSAGDPPARCHDSSESRRGPLVWLDTSKPTAALRQLLHRCNIQNMHARALRQVNDPLLPQFGESPADGLDRQSEEVADVGARHRQIDHGCISSIARVAARHCEQEGGDALDGATLTGR